MSVKKYFDYLNTIFNEVIENEIEQIHEAAKLVAESCEKNGRFYVFGSGHSHMIAEEVYLRAGGLAWVKGILPGELMLHEMPNKSTYLERLEGYGESLLKLYEIDKNDTLLIASNSGRNNVPVEMALKAKELGVKVISLSSVEKNREIPSRHKSKLKINDIADISIDNRAPKGDAGFEIEGLDTAVGASSTFTGVAIVQGIVTHAIELMVEKGIKPPVFKSSNVDGADSYNSELFDKYYGYWK